MKRRSCRAAHSAVSRSGFQLLSSVNHRLMFSSAFFSSVSANMKIYLIVFIVWMVSQFIFVSFYLFISCYCNAHWTHWTFHYIENISTSFLQASRLTKAGVSIRVEGGVEENLRKKCYVIYGGMKFFRMCWEKRTESASWYFMFSNKKQLLSRAGDSIFSVVWFSYEQVDRFYSQPDWINLSM